MDNTEPKDIMATDAAATLVDCAGMQDITSARALHEQLREALAAGAPVTLDVSQTERLDGAAAQLLYAFVREAAAHDIPVTWQQPSEAVRNSAHLLGMEAGLNLDPQT